MISILKWIGGPDDGAFTKEDDLPLEVGDAVRCSCHEARYDVVGTEDDGFVWRVEYAPEINKVPEHGSLEKAAA